MDPITALILAGVGTAGNIFGLSKSAQENKRYNKYLDDMFRKNETMYQTEYNTPYLDTEEAKAYLRTLLDQVKETTKDQESKGAITGQSAEKAVATKEAMGKNLNTSITQLAGYGTQRKDRIKSDYLNRTGQLDQMKLQSILSNMQNWGQFGQNAMGLGQGALLAGTTGAFDDTNGYLSFLLGKNPNYGMKKSIPGLGTWGS
jgi:hypothetical protein